MEVYNILSLQELDLKIRSINKMKSKNKGKDRRGGKKVKKIRSKSHGN